MKNYFVFIINCLILSAYIVGMGYLYFFINTEYIQPERIELLKSLCPNMSEECLDRLIVEPHPFTMLFPMVIAIIGAALLLFVRCFTPQYENEGKK